jgi:hypothetical protein
MVWITVWVLLTLWHWQSWHSLVILVSVATMKWWHDDIVEAVDHHWLLPTFILDVCKVFEQHHMLLIGIWVHPPYTVTPAKLAQILVIRGNCGYEMMAWWHCWGCRPPLFASYNHIRYGMCLSTFICCGYAYGCTLTLLHLWMLPRLEMMAWLHCWGCRPPLTASHIHNWCMKSFWAPSYAVDRHMGALLHCYTWQSWPKCW